jgi:hypothetical protein
MVCSIKQDSTGKKQDKRKNSKVKSQKTPTLRSPDLLFANRDVRVSILGYPGI